MRQIDERSEASRMMASAIVCKAVKAFAASCLLLALTAFSTVAWAQLAYVHEVSGTVSLQQTPGKAVPAQIGDTFGSGTILSTGISGKATLKFADGQIVLLSSDSILRVGQYRYDAKNLKQSGSTVTLTKGEMRFVTGVIGAERPEGIRITVGLSTLGILKPGGADFIVKVNSVDGQEFGLAAVAMGEIGVLTPYGKIVKIEASQMAPWQPGRALTLPTPIAAAPAVIQAAATALFAILVPANAPVNVASAAVGATFTVSVTTGPTVSAASKFSFSDAAALLAALPATAAGTAQAQVSAPIQVAANATGFPVAPVPPPVTSGGSGRCRGSDC